MKLKNSKRIVSFIAIQISFFILSCGETTKHQGDPNNIKALEVIKKEIKVKDAIITDANVLYVSVEDDGTLRNGYAQYLCEILNENNATTAWVKIVKVNSSNDSESDNAYGVLLGEAHCE